MALDVNLQLRTGTVTLTADETQNAGVDVGPTAINGLSCVVVVPSVGTYAADRLEVKVQECTESATDSTYWVDLVTFPLISAAGRYTRRFASKLRYIRVSSTIQTFTVTTGVTYGGMSVDVGNTDWDKVDG